MRNEIGSYFLLEKIKNKNKNNFLKNKIESYGSNYMLLNNGRSALSMIAQKYKYKTIYLPDFLCETMISPFEDNSLIIKYYEIDENFNIIYEDDFLQTDLFLIINLFSFSNEEYSNSIKTTLKKVGVIIIEDLTHSFFNNKENVLSDYYIVSLRKWFGIPSGGILISDKQLESNNYDKYSLEKIDVFKKASFEKEGYLSYKSEDKFFLKMYNNFEETFDEDNKIYLIDELSKEILNKFDYFTMIERRKENLSLLSNFLKKQNFSWIRKIYYNKDEPQLFLVLKLKKEVRENFRTYMISNKVYTPVHWPVPDSLSKNYNMLYDTLISVPIDQRYSAEDMNKIKKLFLDYDDKYMKRGDYR